MNSKSQIKKIAKTLDVNISTSGVNMLNNLIIQLSHILSTKSVDGYSLESMDVKRYLQSIPSDPLIKEMINKGDVAILQYNSVDESLKKEPTMSERAKLTLSIEKIEKLIESQVNKDVEVEVSAPIYITAIIEYCITQILSK